MYRVDTANIEITNICNLECSFCPQSIMSRQKQYMPLDMAKMVLDQIKEQNISPVVHLHLMGEPMLHRDFISIVEHADKLGIRVILLTNATLLSEEKIDKLLTFKNIEICISARILDDATFLKNNHNLNLDAHLGKIKDLIIENIKRGSHIRIVLKIFKKTFYSSLLPKSLGIKRFINLETFYELGKNIYKELNIQKDLKIKCNYFSLLDRTKILENTFVDTEMLINWDSDKFQNGKYYNAIIGSCIALKGSVAVLVNGDVTCCCRDYNGELVLGNILNQTLGEILDSKKAQLIRSSLKRFQLPTVFCKRCRGGPTLLTSILNQSGSVLGIHKIGY